VGAREAIEREPLILGLMFPQGQGAWTASFVPTETTIEWEFLQSLAKLADCLGFDYLFMGNGYYTKGGYGGHGRTRAAALDATTVAAALASVTRRLLLISTIHTAYHCVHPLFFAKAGATLDWISNGRWGPNFVAGISELNARHFGVPWLEHDHRYEMSDEFVTVVKRIWSDPEPVTFQGKFIRTEGAWMAPKPPRLPLMVNAGVSDVGLDFAARHCDWVFTSVSGEMGLTGTRNMKAAIARIKGFGRRYDRDLKTAANVYVICRETESDAYRAFDEICEHADLETIDAMRSPGKGLVDSEGSKAFVDKARVPVDRTGAVWGGIRVIGNPNQVADRLIEFKENGLDCISLVFHNYIRDLKFFGEHVLPLLKHAGLRRIDSETANSPPI
jgi:alkanesulfonate monooxygenase SsuD/methylene tetrahydromethanopterin reductase-like flavin-dependent oxidoreductase (luciferase family)